MGALLRFFIGRRLLRFLPGGWVTMLLAPPAFRFLRNRLRRRRGSGPPPGHGG
jgi:hypothetical protein